jgi:15-cis-phytoene synthase
MNLDDDDLTPPERLALAYTPRAMRDSFSLLLRLDSRFATIVANVSEPLFGQLKLAWWRDALLAGSAEGPKGEPLLASLYKMDYRELVEAAVALANAWETLVVYQDWAASTVQTFADERGTAVFGAYAKLLGEAGFPEEIGQEWAENDLRIRFGSRVVQTPDRPVILPSRRDVRPLTILAMSVRKISGPRLVWHALTGR